MRRWIIGVAMAGLLGGCAEAGRDFAAESDPAVQRIEAFIAAQRDADSRTCAAQGYRTDTIGHRWCVRKLAAQRRAAIEGQFKQQREHEAGWCLDERAAAAVRCLDI